MFLLLNISSLIFSLIVSCAITLSAFYSFYPQSPAFLIFLCVLSAVITLISAISVKPLYRPFTSVTGAFTTINLTYNFAIALLSLVLITLTALLPPYRERIRRILFTNDCTPVTINYAPPKKAKTFFLRASVTGFFVSTLLFILTFIFTTPVGIWNLRAFPIDISPKTIYGEYAVPSGVVTCAVAYDAEAIIVDGFSPIETENGTIPSPAFTCGMRKGDVITKINNQRAKTSDFLTKGSDGTAAVFEGVRLDATGELIDVRFTITPSYSIPDEKYMIGIYYYADIAPGIYSTVQTVSFTYPDTGFFAATAHSSEIDARTEGYTHILREADIIGRDENGLIATAGDTLGSVLHMNRFGAFGVWKEDNQNALPIAKKHDFSFGKATLLSSFEKGIVEEYEVFITGTYRIDQRDVICLIATDETLLSQGGITRGMSGSPILQDGKIIGALSNTDSKGYCAYATFACDMAHEIYLCKDILSQEATLNDT